MKVIENDLRDISIPAALTYKHIHLCGVQKSIFEHGLMDHDNVILNKSMSNTSFDKCGIYF